MGRPSASLRLDAARSFKKVCVAGRHKPPERDRPCHACHRFVVLAKDPVIEACKRDVDRTLLRENLKLTPEQRLAKMVSALAFLEELRRATDRAKSR